MAKPSRVGADRIADLVSLEAADVGRLVRELRRMVLRAAPRAEESVKFHCLCYSVPGAWFGAIGGNVCMIEATRGRVALSFLQGVGLADPHRLLRGTGKAKRRAPIAGVEEARDPRLARLVRASWEQASAGARAS